MVEILLRMPFEASNVLNVELWASCNANELGFSGISLNTCILGRSGSVRSARTTINSASEQVSDLYSVSFKRSDSVREWTYKRLPTELINFAHGGSRDQVSQWELNKNIQMADVFVIESIHGTTVSNLKTAVCSQNTYICSSVQPQNALKVIPLDYTPPRSREFVEKKYVENHFFETKKMMKWTWR